VKRFIPIICMISCSATDMSANWQLDRLRLLAVRAEVDADPDLVLGTRAEPRPGETVLFSSLKYIPEDTTVDSTIWSACIPDFAYGFGCEIDNDAIEEAFGGLNDDSSYQDILEAFEAARNAGLIGFEPDWAPEWTVPSDALDSLSEAEAKEGVNAFINIVLSSSTTNSSENTELTYKRMPVSDATTPNHNPDIADFVIAGVALDGAVGFNARTGSTYTIEPVLSDGHVETYEFLNGDGELEWRTEEPYFTWFTETGSSKSDNRATFDSPESLHPYSSVEWTAPSVAGEILLHTVVRDRRGGMGWRSLRVNVL
jgi:hypothetical protein